MSVDNKDQWLKFLNVCKNINNKIGSLHQGSSKLSAHKWTVRAIRIGLENGVLESNELGIRISDNFWKYFRGVVSEKNIEDLGSFIDNFVEICARTVLRTHPGGNVDEEDLDYLINEVYAALIFYICNLAESFGMLFSSDDSSLGLTEDFINEFANVLAGKAHKDSADPGFIKEKIAQLSKAFGLAAGNGNSLDHTMAAMGVYNYLEKCRLIERL